MTKILVKALHQENINRKSNFCSYITITNFERKYFLNCYREE